jgi:hypothetical protein
MALTAVSTIAIVCRVTSRALEHAEVVHAFAGVEHDRVQHAEAGHGVSISVSMAVSVSIAR